MSNTTRIAKNTLMLYFRQILIMLVSLYTMRVVLETLGAEDYGIYNVVAGVVTMFGFLSGAMATASQRYFAFELGRGDYEQLKRVFALSLTIYLLIAIVVLVLAETIGLWFVNTTLVIPLERRIAGLWVYHASIVSFLFAVLTVPYMAMLIAYEDMNIYAYISIVEVLLKLAAVFMLRFILLDKLQLYGILMSTVVLFNAMIYRTVCALKYRECKYRFYWDKKLFREMVSYTGWNLFGGSAGIFKLQIVNILLNQFFNPIIISARGIASSINGAISNLSQNFGTAMRPQIIKTYAVGKKDEMLSLVFRGIKVIYFLTYLFVLPLILEMPMVLSLWLKNTPEHTVLFVRFALIDVLIESISYPIMAAVQATGKIKLYQTLVGGILLLNLPVVWITLWYGAPAYSVMIIAICLTGIEFIVRLLIVKSLIVFSLVRFVVHVLVPIVVVSFLSTIFSLILHIVFLNGIARLVLTICLSSIVTCFFIYICGLSSDERSFIKNVVMNRLHIITVSKQAD